MPTKLLLHCIYIDSNRNSYLGKLNIYYYYLLYITIFYCEHVVFHFRWLVCLHSHSWATVKLYMYSDVVCMNSWSQIHVFGGLRAQLSSQQAEQRLRSSLLTLMHTICDVSPQDHKDTELRSVMWRDWLTAIHNS